MDKEKFKEKVDEYLLFDKRSLAEMLAMRDLKEESEGITPQPVDYRIRRFCSGIQNYCYEETCNGCLFNQLKPTQTDGTRIFFVNPENLPKYDRNTDVSLTRTFSFVTTSTAGKIG
jgi:hypothetical protein